MMKPTLISVRRIRCLVLLLGVTVTGAAVPIAELMVRPVPAAPTVEQQLAQLQQQLQSLQAQLAAMQAIVQVTPSSTAGQEPNLTIAAGNIVLRASNDLATVSGSSTSIQASAAVDLRASSGMVLRAAGPLALDGSIVRLNGGARPVATVGSVVQTTVPVRASGPPITVAGQIVSGSQQVFSN